MAQAWLPVTVPRVPVGALEFPQVPRLIFLPGMNEITMAQMLIANQIDMAFSFTPANLKLVQGQNQAVITHYDRPPYGYMDWWPIGLGRGLSTTRPAEGSVPRGAQLVKAHRRQRGLLQGAGNPASVHTQHRRVLRLPAVRDQGLGAAQRHGGRHHRPR